MTGPKTWRNEVSDLMLGGNPKRRFISFIIVVLVGLITSYLTIRKGVRLTPESFRDFVVSLGMAGPLIYIGVFIVRPLLLIPSIALFIGGGWHSAPSGDPLMPRLVRQWEEASASGLHESWVTISSKAN